MRSLRPARRRSFSTSRSSVTGRRIRRSAAVTPSAAGTWMPSSRITSGCASPGPPSAISASDLRHRARGLHEQPVRDVVLELLGRDGGGQEPRQLLVAGARAQRSEEVVLAQREQTGAELAVRGEADAVAACAEGRRHRVDEADATGRAVGEQPVDRKSTRLNSSHVKISYAVFCL